MLKGVNSHIVEGAISSSWLLITVPHLVWRTEIPKEDMYIKKPAFFAAARKDHVCVWDYAVPEMEKYAVGGLKIVEFQGGHWLQLEEPEMLNRELEGWILDTL